MSNTALLENKHNFLGVGHIYIIYIADVQISDLLHIQDVFLTLLLWVGVANVLSLL